MVSEYTVVDESGRKINNLQYLERFIDPLFMPEDLMPFVYYCFTCDDVVEYPDRKLMRCRKCSNHRYVRVVEDDRDHHGYAIWKR